MGVLHLVFSVGLGPASVLHPTARAPGHYSRTQSVLPASASGTRHEIRSRSPIAPAHLQVACPLRSIGPESATSQAILHSVFRTGAGCANHPGYLGRCDLRAERRDTNSTRCVRRVSDRSALRTSVWVRLPM